jgi:CubicO group peptidase (beta-lactamase class C family)
MLFRRLLKQTLLALSMMSFVTPTTFHAALPKQPNPSSPSMDALPKAVKRWGGAGCPSDEALRAFALQTIRSIPRVVGVSIAITHPTCGSMNLAFGEANILKHQPMSERTKLPIASNTKPILLVLALMLIENHPSSFPAGINTKLTEIRDKNNKVIFTADAKVMMPDGRELNLADPDFFKQRTGLSYDCKKDPIYQCANLAEIDLHHLLLESSGLADYIRETDLSHDNLPDMLKFTLSKLFSPHKDPGSKEVESDLSVLKKFGVVKKSNPDPIIPAQSHNTDASLLAIILERVSGLSLNELLAQNILQPLGLEKDAMQFVSEYKETDETVARRYALLNTDNEIEAAIAAGSILPRVSESMARQFKPSFLTTLGRHVYRMNATQSAIDVLDLHGQGIFAYPGPGGIIAEPKAYIRFYQAFASGKLLSPKAQALFQASFIPQTSSSEDYSLATGYASNDKMQWVHSPQAPTFLVHGGFVPGGESWVMYNYESGLTVMVATNTSGMWRRALPLLFVTPTAYFDKSAILDLDINYAKRFNLF